MRLSDCASDKFGSVNFEGVYDLGEQQIQLLKKFGPLLEPEYKRSCCYETWNQTRRPNRSRFWVGAPYGASLLLRELRVIKSRFPALPAVDRV
jgi:hypothetical protein